MIISTRLVNEFKRIKSLQQAKCEILIVDFQIRSQHLLRVEYSFINFKEIMAFFITSTKYSLNKNSYKVLL